MPTNLLEQDQIKIQNILMETLEVKREQITPEARITEDLGADSLDVVDITMQVEETFHVAIPDEQIENVSTVEDLCHLLAEHLKPS